MADVLKKVPVREQDPAERARNFEEVCLGYNQDEAMDEAALLKVPCSVKTPNVSRDAPLPSIFRISLPE